MGGGSERWVELRVLGPFEATAGGEVLAVGGPRLRAVLALLVAGGGRVVGVTALAEGLWGEHQPPDAERTVRTYVSRLRKILPVEDLIVTSPPGYVLRLAEEAVDARRFEALALAGRRELGAGRAAAAGQALSAALALWRGEAYGEFADVPELLAEGSRLELLRQGAVEDRIEADLAAGAGAELVAELEGLTARYAGHERLWGQLMRALYRAGRQADALAAFGRARQRLVEESGLEPSPDLAGIHRQVLAQDPRLLPTQAVEAGSAPVAGPALLPRAVRSFTGRARELAALDALLPEAGGADPQAVAPIFVVSGTAGVGKTALAVNWAHRVRPRFPDGQLHVNLRGFDPGGQVVEAAAAVRVFLDALGVPPERVPASLEAQVGLYRSVLAGRRALVVIDNARDADHVRPLLPGTGAAVAVVTSRNSLTDLVAADGAHPVALDLLTEAESRQLLERRLGPGRVAAEPEAARQLVGLCARLPLALTLVAARAATHPTFSLAAVAAELAEATGRTAVPDDTEDVIGQVRAVFSWSYTTLTAPAARLFRLLGLHPGPHTAAPAAASLAGQPVAQVRRLLGELTRAGLLTEVAPGRYGCHDLLTAYATHLTRTTDTDQEREAATVRLLDHYTHTAHTAERHLNPARDPIPVPLAPAAPGAAPEPLADQKAATAWLNTERPVLLAAQRLAAEAGWDTHAWQLAWSLHTTLRQWGRWHELAGVWRAALPAADRLPHPAAATAHSLLGRAATMLGETEQARTHLHHALHLDTEAGDAAGQAYTHNDLSLLWERQGRPDRALDHARQAHTLYQVAGHSAGEAYALNAIGWYHALLGDHTTALTYCQQALALHERLGDRAGEASAWDSLGYAHNHLDQYARAAECYQHASTVYGELGDRVYQAGSLTALGETHHAAGQPDQARTAWTSALEILTDLDHPDAENLRGKLATLDQTAG